MYLLRNFLLLFQIRDNTYSGAIVHIEPRSYQVMLQHYHTLPLALFFQGRRKQFRSGKADQRGGVAAPLVRMRRIRHEH